jgi:hypothetical protein
MWEPKSPGTLWATPGLLRNSFTFITERAQYKICFSVDIRVGMVGDILVGLLPEKLNACRYNDMKTDLQDLRMCLRL